MVFPFSEKMSIKKLKNIIIFIDRLENLRKSEKHSNKSLQSHTDVNRTITLRKLENDNKENGKRLQFKRFKINSGLWMVW